MASKKGEQEFVPQIGIKNVPMEVAAKLQYIAGVERLTNAEVYNLAFVKFIELYEAKNGKIKIQPKGKGLENL